MLPQLLDSYQLKAKKCFQEKDHLLINGKRDSGKSFFLRQLVAEKLLNGKKVLYVTHDKKRLQSTIRFFKAMGLNQHLLHLEEDLSISNEQIEVLLELMKSSEEIPHDLESSYVKVNYENHRIKAEGFYKTINHKVLFDKPWHELVVLQAFDKNSSPTLHYNHQLPPLGYQFGQEEYEKLLDAVLRAFVWVEKDEAFTDKLFIADNYLEVHAEVAWKRIGEWIAEGRKRTSKLIISLDRYLDKLLKAEQRNFLEKIGDLKQELESILTEIRQQRILVDSTDKMARGNILFGNKNNTVKQIRKQHLELVEKLNNCLDRIRQGEKTIYKSFTGETVGSQEPLENLEELVHKFLVQIGDIRPAMTHHIRQKLDALNSNQNTDPSLQKIDEEIDLFYRWLNEHKQVETDFSSTAFSIHKKLGQLEALLTDFNFYESREWNFKRYFDWNKFYHSASNQEKNLIDKLMVIRPADWISFFRNWYVQNALEHFGPLYHSSVENELIKMVDLYQQIFPISIGGFEKNKAALKKDWLVNHRGVANDIKKSLKKNSENGLSWERFLSTHFELISLQYPLVLICSEQLEAVSGHTWDLVVLREDEWSAATDTNWEKIRKLGTQSILAVDQEGTEDVINSEITKEEICFLPFKGIHQQNIIPMSEMNHTERLYAARNLAYLLEDINQDISVYQLGDYVIFSCLSEPLNKVMEKLMDKRGIKKMRILESPFHMLVENLLEVKLNRILLTQDFLINNNSYETLEWQLFVRKRFEKAGLKIVDFKTHELLVNPVQAIIRFSELYFPNQAPTFESGNEKELKE